VLELLRRGDLVTVLTRDPSRAKKHLPHGVRVAAWDPHREGAWYEELDVVDAVVHLAGEMVVKRWTDATKAEIERSRVDSTAKLVEAIGRAPHKPSVLVSASAIGYYGPHPGTDTLDESAEPGNDFLAGVVQRWEEAARGAEAHGVRSAQVRIGVVLGAGGGALPQMVRPFKLYMGGPIGDGEQVFSWVHLDDVVGIIMLAIDNETLSGPINATSPNAATSEEMAEALGIVLNKPAWFRTPESMLRARFGEGATVLTTGQRVYPQRAAELGYEFQHARLVPALESILGT
jgi:uncharacterized protein